MRLSQRGLYALQALTVLAQHPAGVVKIKDIAAEEELPEKFLDAESLRRRVSTDPKHRPLFRVLLDVRNATARILDHTSLSDLCCRSRN